MLSLTNDAALNGSSASVRSCVCLLLARALSLTHRAPRERALAPVNTQDAGSTRGQATDGVRLAFCLGSY